MTSRQHLHLTPCAPSCSILVARVFLAELPAGGDLIVQGPPCLLTARSIFSCCQHRRQLLIRNFIYHSAKFAVSQLFEREAFRLSNLERSDTVVLRR